MGVVDVKSYHVETPEEVADRARRCLEFAPAERLSLAPDCGLSQTARWAARAKLAALGERTRRNSWGSSADRSSSCPRSRWKWWSTWSKAVAVRVAER